MSSTADIRGTYVDGWGGHIGPVPRVTQGEQICTMCNGLFYALTDQEAETVADTLIEGKFSRFEHQRTSIETKAETLIRDVLLSFVNIEAYRKYTYAHAYNAYSNDGLVGLFNLTTIASHWHCRPPA